MCHKLRKQYDEKVCRVMEQRHRGDSRHSRWGNKYYHHNYKWQDCNHSGCHSNYDKHKKKQEDRTPSDCGNKAFKPCSMHGPKSKHTSEECYKNPKNQNMGQTHNKNINTRCTTTTRITQVTTMSRPLAPIHRSQVRTRRQPPAKAKPTRMRIFIFMLIRN